MPGIAGIVSRMPAAESKRMVAAMLDSMRLEPFYVDDVHHCERLGVCAGWVAHPTSYAARNSGIHRDGLVTILSGECLGENGAADVSGRYRAMGEGFVAGLNGLFSGIVIDASRKRILLFNDRYGIERLYYHENENGLFFASDAKALLAVLPELRLLDSSALTQLLAFGCTLDWQTLFRGVSLLKGGTIWPLGEDRRSPQQYFVPSTWESQPGLSVPEFQRAFQETFKRVLPRYVGDGSDVGISLTGGLDTRMIMACLPELAHKPITYTFSGERDKTIDERLAATVAKTRHLEHRILRIGSDFLENYSTHVDQTVLASDGSFGATGAHEIYLNRRARELAPIRLTGNFGSEVLRSMSTFKPLQLRPELLEPGLAHDVETLSAAVQRRSTHPVTQAVFRDIPWGLFGSLAAGRSQLTFRTPYLDNELVALAFRAPHRARQSPDAALQLVNRAHAELGRLPTDRGVLLHDREPGRTLRRVFSEVTFKLDYLHKEGLPDWLSPFDPLFAGLNKTGILGLHKYLPYRRWFRAELAPRVLEVLTDPRTSRLPYWNSRSLALIASDHINGRRNCVKEINAVLTLEAIDRLLIDGSPQSRASVSREAPSERSSIEPVSNMAGLGK